MITVKMNLSFMLERLKLFFKKPTSQTKATSLEVEKAVEMEPTSTRLETEKPIERKITSTWQEKVAELGIAPGSRPPIDPEQKPIKPHQLTGKERDAWMHERRMQKLGEGERYGLRVAYMHISALSPTTRKTHAARHGQLFTAAQVRNFWSIEENRTGCKCSIAEVIVDESGTPIVPAILERAQEMYQNYKIKYGSS